MPAIRLLLIAITLALPIAWLVSEYRAKRPLRIVLGISAVLSSFAVAALIGTLSRLSYNAWYGGATKDLIGTTIEQIEDGHLDRVLKVLRGLDLQYDAKYENRDHYDVLVTQATERMRGETEITTGSQWDAKVFDKRTWVGHWENDTGFWIVINDLGDPLDVIRSGDPPETLETISLSSDCRILVCRDKRQMRYTFTLSNKYEAQLEWFDVKAKSVWNTEVVHKLIRATEEQKRVTQQDKASRPSP